MSIDSQLWCTLLFVTFYILVDLCCFDSHAPLDKLASKLTGIHPTVSYLKDYTLETLSRVSLSLSCHHLSFLSMWTSENCQPFLTFRRPLSFISNDYNIGDLISTKAANDFHLIRYILKSNWHFNNVEYFQC